MKALTPNRPYLLRAYYDWLMDNQLTPHVVVDAFVKGTQVPQQYVKDGQIVLNIAAGAVGNLQIGNEFVEFNARFWWCTSAGIIANGFDCGHLRS